MLAFERMTVFCRDLDASLAFYRDLLGLVVLEEKVLEGPGAGMLLRLPACQIRIAMLAADSAAPAVLGLFEISGTSLDSLEPRLDRPHHGQTALVLRTDEFDRLSRRLATAGVSVLTPPLHYPKAQAGARSPAGIYREMIVHDPDGTLVSLLQIDPLPDTAAGTIP